MDLLSNAICSIRLGVQDYQTGTSERILSAVRNVHAGVLLLYKEALRRRSPPGSEDVLIKAVICPKVDEAGHLVFVGIGKRTVDVFEIRRRFKGLGIRTDWALLERITEARNDLEHYVPKHTQAGLEGLIATAFNIVSDFVKRELEEDPLTILGEETWQAMLDVSEVYERELAACKSEIEAIAWESDALAAGVSELSCLECGSDLLHPTVVKGETLLSCLSCGDTESRDLYVPRAINIALSCSAYSAMKDGGDDPFTTCPECGEETYVMSERRCALCHAELLHTCERCGSDIPASEMMCAPYCGYCEHMYQRMLEE